MKPAFFAANRKRLCEQLKPGSFVALTGYGDMQRDNDQPFGFAQEGNFWYLTGLEEPGWRLFVDVDSAEEWLVAPSSNFYHTAFIGGLSAEQAMRQTGVAHVVTKTEGKALLRTLLAKKTHAYTLIPLSTRVYGFQPNRAPRQLITHLKGVTLHDIRQPLAVLRAIKQPFEIEAMQQAVDVTTAGIEAVMNELKHYTYEYEADAKLYYEFRRRGATHGFDPIIASGNKTCIMHAPAANDRLHGWLLLDVGARVRGYTADITRTIPLHPPTGRQRQVYEAVQRMHNHFEQIVKPGASVSEVLMHDAYPYVGEEMVQLGLLKKPRLTRQGVFKFMPHAITHGLGVDAHDPLGRPEFFQEHMALTNEVGIYIPEEGFGIRIENDMIITKDGARNMGATLPIDLAAMAGMVY